MSLGNSHITKMQAMQFIILRTLVNVYIKNERTYKFSPCGNAIVWMLFPQHPHDTVKPM